MGFFKIGLFLAKIYKDHKKLKMTKLYVLLKINNNHGRHILLTHLAEIEASNIKNLANYNLI